MKKLIWGLLGLGAVACQPEQKTQSARVVPVAAAVTPPARPVPPGPPADTATLTAPMLALLRQFNLAALWKSEPGARLNKPRLLDGFMGPDQQRISLAFTEAYPDSANPALLRVAGKSFFKKEVNPLTGTIDVKGLRDLPLDWQLIHDLPEGDTVLRAYTATFHFGLQQSAGLLSKGKFEGTGVMDFFITSSGYCNLAGTQGTDTGPARGRGLLLRGQWRGENGQAAHSLLFSPDPFVVAPDVLQHFGVGERGNDINPKYAKLGWNEYWENQEWWADSPPASLNL